MSGVALEDLGAEILQRLARVAADYRPVALGDPTDLGTLRAIYAGVCRACAAHDGPKPPAFAQAERVCAAQLAELDAPGYVLEGDAFYNAPIALYVEYGVAGPEFKALVDAVLQTVNSERRYQLLFALLAETQSAEAQLRARLGPAPDAE